MVCWAALACMVLLGSPRLVPWAPPLLAAQRPPTVRFVREGLLWSGAAVSSQSPTVRMDGKPLSGQALPNGQGWLFEAKWSPRQSVELSWGQGSDTRRKIVRAPLRPSAMVWHVLDWPPRRFAELGDADVLTALRFSPDGRYLAMGSQQGRMAVLQVERGKIIWRAHRPGRLLRQFVFSADGKLLIAGEQGPEGRVSAYRLDRPGADPLWYWDSADDLGTARAVSGNRWGWVQYPGAYRLLRVDGHVLAAFSRSWSTPSGRRSRARLMRLDIATGRVLWRYPLANPAQRIMTWISATDRGDRIALPLQIPLGTRVADDPASATRIEILDGDDGSPRFSEIVPPLPPFPVADIWRGVALHPAGKHLAVATEDGRGLLYSRDVSGWRLSRQLTLVQPMNIAGHRVAATNGTATATEREVIFATGPSYVPVEFGAGTPRGEHRRSNTVFAFSWQGETRWVWPMGSDLQGLALSGNRELLVVLMGREDAQPAQTFAGIALLNLTRGGSGRERLEYRFPLQGRAIYDGVAASHDGRWIAVGEAPRTLRDDPRPQGRSRVWILR